MSRTTISVQPEIRDTIRDLKRGDEPYDDVMLRLLDAAGELE